MEIKKLHQKFQTLADRDYNARTPMVLRQHWTNKNSIDMPSDHSGSRKCNSTVRGRDSVNMPKLNMAALEQLNQNTQRTGSELKNSDYVAEGSPSPIGRGIKDERVIG